MPHVITSLCLREGSCSTVCPVDCITPGNPVDKYPWYYIDPDTCIDCGACAAECPFNAIFPDDEVPSAYNAKGGEYQNMPVGTPGFSEVYDATDHDQKPVHLEAVKTLAAGEILDLTPAIEANAAFYKDGPGYDAAKG
jgi:NAD-dependent dihydropyrimidine dehydrogenase PreA subunit